MITMLWRICIFPLVLLVGCSEVGDLQKESLWRIKIVCQQQPLAEVHVVFHRRLGEKWEAVLEGVSGSDGIAKLQVVPTIDPPKDEEWNEFRITVASLAGGEWLIKEKWTSPTQTDLKVTSYEPAAIMILEVPKQAIGAL